MPRRSVRHRPRHHGQREQHHQDLRRTAHRRDRAARPHPTTAQGKYYREMITESDEQMVDVSRRSRSPRPTCWCATCRSAPSRPRSSTPSAHRRRRRLRQRPAGLHRRHPEWAKKFEDAGVPIVGDDIKSQVGATITHRVLAKLFEDRGVTVDRTYQLNVGGNMDFMNMLERERLSPRRSRRPVGDLRSWSARCRPATCTSAVDYVAWLDDRKWAFIALEGRNFGDVPLSLGTSSRCGTPRTAPASSSTPSAPRRSPGPRYRWPDPVRVELLRHEVAAGAVHRRRGPRGCGLHRRHRRALIRRNGPLPHGRAVLRY